MAAKVDGTEVPHAEALAAWADVAYEELKRVARSYNKKIRYAEISEIVQARTCIKTDMLMQNWVGSVLEITAEKAADAGEPPLTSLCVHADGTIGPGYERAPKYGLASKALDMEDRAAEDRLLCYREYATDLPSNGGRATLTLERGTLAVADEVPFHSHLEVAKLFGRQHKGHQSATIRLNDFTEVWFPKLYQDRDWNNTLSSNNSEITMRHVPGGKYEGLMDMRPIRHYVITFGHIKPLSGPRYYRFLGVFEGAPHLSDNTKWVYQRVSDTLTSTERAATRSCRCGLGRCRTTSLQNPSNPILRSWRRRSGN